MGSPTNSQQRFSRWSEAGQKAMRTRLRAKEERQAQWLSYPSEFGHVVLGFDFYKKQKEALDLCREPGSQVSIACANGGGKTRLLIPTLALWHQSLFPGGIVKITSGAYMQITDQVWPAIREHRDKFPNWKWYETPYVETQCPRTGVRGFISCFTTNEPGRAEGQHELGPYRPLMFIVDEAKSAPDWLKGVIHGRIRPTRLVLLSSHGFSEGYFYESQTIDADQPAVA